MDQITRVEILHYLRLLNSGAPEHEFTSLPCAESALDRTTADGFATVKQNGTGWTWEPHTVGLGPMLSKPTVPYISQRAAYDGLQRAINALLRDDVFAALLAELPD